MEDGFARVEVEDVFAVSLHGHGGQVHGVRAHIVCVQSLMGQGVVTDLDRFTDLKGDVHLDFQGVAGEGQEGKDDAEVDDIAAITPLLLHA